MTTTQPTLTFSDNNRPLADRMRPTSFDDVLGQENFQSRAEIISCDIPLIWNKTTMQLEFSPLSQARFPTQIFNKH